MTKLKVIKYFTIFIIFSILFNGCSYKAAVKGGFEKQNEMFIGVSEWPLNPIELHIWKKDDIGYKCNGVFTKGYTSSGTIVNGDFTFKCIDGKIVSGSWYSPNGQNNLIGKGKDKDGNIFHIIAGTELFRYPNLETDLKNMLAKNKPKPIIKPKPKQKENLEKNYRPKLHILGTGSGFFVSNDGFIITNEHVVSKAKKVSIFLNKKIIECEIIMTDAFNDIALLKANIKSKPIPISSSTINKGASVSAFGYPLLTLQGNELKVTFGHINALSGIKGDFRYFQIDTPIQPGNSGGPLINKYGKVIGIVSATLSQNYTLKNAGVLNQNVNYAIKIDYVQPILKQFHVNTKKLKHKIEKDTEQLVKEIEKSVVIIVSEG